MERVLKASRRTLDAVVYFDIDTDHIVERLSGRLVCEKCQTPYMDRNAGDKCGKCGGTLVRRKDDEPDAIRNRLKVYESQTAPVFDWYKKNGTKIATVNAVVFVEGAGRLAEVEQSAANAGVPTRSG